MYWLCDYWVECCFYGVVYILLVYDDVEEVGCVIGCDVWCNFFKMLVGVFFVVIYVENYLC